MLETRISEVKKSISFFLGELSSFKKVVETVSDVLRVHAVISLFNGRALNENLMWEPASSSEIQYLSLTLGRLEF